MATPSERAEQVMRSIFRQADRAITLSDPKGRAAMADLLRMLDQANQALEDRLKREAARHGGPTARFTGASALAYQRQVQAIRAFVEARLRGLTTAQAFASVRTGWNLTTRQLTAMEKVHRGIARPLRIDQERIMAGAVAGFRSSLLDEIATSVDRYGQQHIREFEATMRQGLLMGASQHEMIQALVGHGGPTGIVSMAAREVAPGVVQRLRLEAIPEGLFKRYRYWAVRIVRTETARAQNGAAMLAMQEAQALDFPDLRKKILAMLDARTYPDSLAVHGQVRQMGEPFMDGAGRVYQYPPARPNDREVVVPWRPDWRETKTTRPRPVAEVAKAMNDAQPKNPRTRPRMSLAQIRALISQRRRALRPPTPEELGEGERLAEIPLPPPPPPPGPAFAPAVRDQLAALEAEVDAFFDRVPIDVREGRTLARRALAVEQYLDHWVEQAAAVPVEHGRRKRVRDLIYQWTGAWTSSSVGARATIGRALATVDTISDAALLEIASDVGSLASAAEVRESLLRYRAAVQVAHRRAGLPERITIYRGVQGDQAREIRRRLAAGEPVEVLVRSVSSWSIDRRIAADFAGEAGVIFEVEVHRAELLADFRLQGQYDAYVREQELVLIRPEERVELRPDQIALQDR